MQKTRPMQGWAHASIQRELEEAEENMRPYLDSQGYELVYYRVNGYWMFWVQRKRRKSIIDSTPDFADDVDENFKAWTSGLIFSLVDFAIAIENLRAFVHQLKHEAATSNEGEPHVKPHGSL